MLTELIKHIVAMADAQREPKKMDLPGGEHYLLRFPDGSHQIEKTPRHRVERFVDTVESLERLLAAFHEADDYPPGSTQAFISVIDTDSSILLVCHPYGAARGDEIRCELPYSPSFMAFCDLAEGVTPAQFINIVRENLMGCVPPQLINQIRSIDFHSGSTTSVTVASAGRESMGRTVELKAIGNLEPIPDTVHVSFSVLRDATIPVEDLSSVSTDAIVKIDHKAHTIALIIPNDGLAVARLQAKRLLASALTKRTRNQKYFVVTATTQMQPLR